MLGNNKFSKIPFKSIPKLFKDAYYGHTQIIKLYYRDALLIKSNL